MILIREREQENMENQGNEVKKKRRPPYFRMTRSKFLRRKIITDRQGTIYLEKWPFYKNGWFLLFAGTLVIAIGLLLTKGEPSSSETVKFEQPTNSSFVGVKESQTGNADMLSTEDYMLVDFGQSGSSDDLQLTVDKVGEVKEISEGENYSYIAEKGSKFALIHVVLSNQGTQSVSTGIGYFRLLDDKIQHSPTQLVGQKNRYISMEAINPGLETAGYLVFKVPDELIIENCLLKFSGTSIFDQPILFSLKE